MNDDLTPREKQTAILAASGLSNRDVARTLGLTEGTVKQYLHSVTEKTGAHRPELRDLAPTLQVSRK